MSATSELPALLGGLPVRPGGPPRWPPRDADVIAALHRAAADGAWGRYHGPLCKELERMLRQFHDVEHAWLCSSGTAAVELALRGVGVGRGDEVILAVYDFKANFSNVLALGAVPVLVDVNVGDWQLDVGLVSAAITPKTKAIIASHLHGGCVDISALSEIIADRPIAIVEDACQCPGAWIGGRRAGTLGDIGVLSFGGSKLTAAGRGGAVLTRCTQFIERIKRHVLRGNDLSPLSELQAAVLIPQWNALDERNKDRAVRVRELFELLAGVPALRMLTDLDRQSGTAYYKVGFEYASQSFAGLSRELCCRAMRAEGIALSPGFRCLHRIHASRRFRMARELVVANDVDEAVVVLHHPVLLGTHADIRQFVDATRKIHDHAAEIQRRAADLPPDVPVDHE